MLRRLVPSLVIFLVAFAARAQTCTPPTIVQIGGTNPSCAGTPVTLDAGDGWTTYQWSNGATGRYLTDLPSATTSYTVTVTSSSCNVTSPPLEIVVNAPPATPSIDTPATSICPYGSEGATVAGDWQALNWTITNGFFIDGLGNKTTTSNLQSVYFTPDGGTSDIVLHLLVMDSNGCWSSEATRSIPIRTIPTPLIESDVTEICPYGSAGATTGQPAEGSWQTYVWHIDNGFFVDGFGNKSTGSSQQSVYFTPDGGTSDIVLHLMAMDSFGCWTSEATKSIPIRTIPPPLIESDVTEICPYGSAGATTGQPAQGSWQTYAWNIDNGFFVDGLGNKSMSSSQQSVYFTPDGGTSDIVLHLRAMDSLGCWTNEATKSIPIRTIPTPLIETDVAEICPYGSGGATTAPPAQGSWQTYVWNIDNGFFVDGLGNKSMSSSQQSVYFTPDGGTRDIVLHLRAMDSLGCWTNEATKSIPIRTIPAPLIETDVTEICPYGTSNAGVSAPPTGSWQTYAWNIENGVFVDGLGNKSTSSNQPYVTFTPDGGTSYVVVQLFAQDSLGCWTEQTAKIVPIRTITAPPINTVSELCANAQGNASVDGNWQSVQWSITNGLFVDPFGATSNSASGAAVTFTPNGGSDPVMLSAVVSDTLGCSATASAQVNVAAGTPAVIDSANAFCANTDAQASTPDAGAGATYDWDVTNATIVAGEASPVVTFTPTGAGDVTLSVRVDVAGGCISTGQKVVPVNATPSFDIRVTQGGGGYTSTAPRVTSNADFQGSYDFCGGTVNLLSTVLDSSWTYTWSTGANGPFLQVTTSGTYTLTATNAAGCSYAKSVTINFKTPPTATISGARAFCPGGSTTLTASGGTSYVWSTGATTASITVSQAGTYSVTVSSDGCSASASATVTEDAAAITADGPTTFCGGGSVTLTANAAQSYLWSNGATTQSITVSDSGAYSVQETFAEGCTLTSNTISVSAGPTAASIVVDDTSVCPGQPVTITSTVTGGSNLSYQWLDADLVPIAGATSPTLVLTPASSGYGYATLRVSDANGCTIDSNRATWYVFNTQKPVITTYGPTTFCGGSMPTQLESSPANSYLWSNGATTRSINVTEAGTYSVTTTDGSGCSSTSDPVTITVLTPPAKPVVEASGPLTFCEGGSVTLTAPDGYTYSWSTGATTRSITVTQQNYYWVTISDGSCSTMSDGVLVTVNPLPSATITPSGPTTFCEGGSVTLTAPDGYTYSWSNGATTRSITVTQTGDYFVTVSNGSCSMRSSTTSVAVNPLPSTTITPSGATTFCEGGSVTLTAPDGYTYAWSNGATTRSITVTQTGDYFVTVSNGTCSARSSTTSVVVNPLPATTITPSGPTTFCEGGSVTLSAPAGYTYSWNSGATTRSITVTQTGDYFVTVSDGTCSASSSTTSVVVNPLPPATITASTTKLCPGSSATLTAPAGYAYSWSTGATTRSISVSQAGTYSVTVSDGTCSASASITITANAPTQITTQPASISMPRNTTRQLSVTATGTAPLQYQWYRGLSGDTTTPITTNGTSSTLTIGPYTKKGTEHYWVRVWSAGCPTSTVNSSTAVITITN